VGVKVRLQPIHVDPSATVLLFGNLVNHLLSEKETRRSTRQRQPLTTRDIDKRFHMYRFGIGRSGVAATAATVDLMQNAGRK
jgi:hypothetical protein